MRNIETVSSFQHVDVEDIDAVDLIDELAPVGGSGQTRHGQETWSCAWAPDCSYFAWSCGGRMVQLIPWDRIKGQLIRTKTTNADSETQEEFTENGVEVQRIEQIEQLYNNNGLSCKAARKRYTLDCGGIVCSLAFGSGTSREDILKMWKRFKFDKDLILATGLQNAKIKVWDCNTGNLLMELIDHKDVVKCLDFAPDGSLLFVSASRDGTLKLWDLNDDGNMSKTLRGKAQNVNGCKWSPCCKKIASVGSSRSVIIWDLEDHRSSIELKGHYHEVVACDFSPDGALLATSSYDTKIIIWDSFTGDAILDLGHLFPAPKMIFAGGANDHYVRGVSFRNDGLHLASICDDGYIRVWDITDPAVPVSVAERPNALCCSYSPNGHTVAVGDRSGGIGFFRSPSEIPRLQHLSRLKIRTNLPSDKVDFLHLPLRMKEYLKYHKI